MKETTKGSYNKATEKIIMNHKDNQNKSKKEKQKQGKKQPMEGAIQKKTHKENQNKIKKENKENTEKNNPTKK